MVNAGKSRKVRKPGASKGKILISDDFDAPLPPDMQATLENPKIFPTQDERSPAKVLISELKASLSKYISRVRAGEEVVITDRGREVARIIPLPWHIHGNP